MFTFKLSTLLLPAQVTMIGKNETTRKAMGQPPAYYFIDVFVLNQVAIANRSHNLHQVMVGHSAREPVDALVLLLRPDGRPWMGQSRAAEPYLVSLLVSSRLIANCSAMLGSR